MQLRKNWKDSRSSICHTVSRPAGCNSERIESCLCPIRCRIVDTWIWMQLRKNWKIPVLPVFCRPFHAIDATQKKLKEKAPPLLPDQAADLVMQLRKNWKRGIRPQAGHSLPRCNSERIESLSTWILNTLNPIKMQLRKNWKRIFSPGRRPRSRTDATKKELKVQACRVCCLYL